MKRLCVFITIAAMFFTALPAQTMEQIFAEMPDSIVPVMTKNNRLDCIDFFKSNMKSNVENIYGGKSEMLAMTGDYILLKPTSRSTVAIRRHIAQGDTVLFVITTYAAPAKESEIALYNTDWKQISAKQYIIPPKKNDFFITADTCNAERLAYAQRIAEDALIFAEWAEEGDTLRFALSLDGITSDEQKKLLPYIRKSIGYKWNGNAFVR